MTSVSWHEPEIQTRSTYFFFPMIDLSASSHGQVDIGGHPCTAESLIISPCLMQSDRPRRNYILR